MTGNYRGGDSENENSLSIHKGCLLLIGCSWLYGLRIERTGLNSRDDAFDQSRRHDPEGPHFELDTNDLAALEEVAGQIFQSLNLGIQNQGFDDAFGVVAPLPVAGKEGSRLG